MSYNTSPRTLTVEEIDDFAVDFCAKIGISHVDPTNLERFIELSLERTEQEIKLQAPMQLATGTRYIIGKVAEMILDDYASKAVRKSRAHRRVSTDLDANQDEDPSVKG